MFNHTLSRDAQKFTGCRVCPVPLSLLLPQVRPEANWQSNAHTCSPTQPALGLLRLPRSHSSRGRCQKTAHPRAPSGFKELWRSQWRRVTQSHLCSKEHKSLSAGLLLHPQPPELPYSYISWLFGKPKVLQSDPTPVIFPAAHH